MAAEALEGRAMLAGAAGEPLRAARLFGAAEALRGGGRHAPDADGTRC